VRQALEKRESEYAFVPFDGANGTTRRPIVIECTDRAIRFVAEDITLSPQDLNGFITDVNPLLAGAGALMKYWEKRGKEEAPYVLLVVRPRGSIAFYVAREMLSPIEQSFGYELVEEDFRLHAPETEPAAVTACRKAIESTLAQRSQVAQRVRHGFPGSSTQLHLREGASTFDLEESTEGPRRGVTASDALLGRRTRARDGFFGSRSFQNRDLPTKGSSRSSAKGSSGSSARGSSLPSTQEQRRGRPGAPEGGADGAAGGSKPRRVSASESFLARAKRDSEAGSGTSRLGVRQTESNKTSRGPGNKPSANSMSSITGTPPNLRGRRWGQSPPGATIGFERDVTIDIDDDELLVGGRRRVFIAERDKLETLVEKVVGALDAHADDWGRPPAGFYWIPSLEFVVHPGGNAHYERLKRRLEELGLETRVKHTLGALRPDARREER
jgi:hypothetical protein